MADAPCVAAVAAAACCVAQAVGSRRLLSLKPGDAVRSVRDIQLSGGVMIYKGCVGIVEKSRGDKPGTIEAKVNGVLFDASINEVVPEPNPENPLLSNGAKPGTLSKPVPKPQEKAPTAASPAAPGGGGKGKKAGKAKKAPPRSSLLCCFTGGAGAGDSPPESPARQRGAQQASPSVFTSGTPSLEVDGLHRRRLLSPPANPAGDAATSPSVSVGSGVDKGVGDRDSEVTVIIDEPPDRMSQSCNSFAGNRRPSSNRLLRANSAALNVSAASSLAPVALSSTFGTSRGKFKPNVSATTDSSSSSSSSSPTSSSSSAGVPRVSKGQSTTQTPSFNEVPASRGPASSKGASTPSFNELPASRAADSVMNTSGLRSGESTPVFVVIQSNATSAQTLPRLDERDPDPAQHEHRQPRGASAVPPAQLEQPQQGGEAKPEEGRLAQQQQQQQQQPPRHQEEITVEVETRGESEDIAPSQPPLYDAKPGGSQASPPSVKGPPQRRTSVPYLFEASVQSASPMGASARYARSVASLGSTYKSPPSAPEACASPKSPATSHFGRSLRSTSRVKVPPDAGYYLPIKGFRSESERAFSAPPADTRSGYAGHAPLPLQQQRSFSVAPALSSTLKTPIRRPTASRSFETSPAISGIVPSYRGPTGTPFVLQPQTDRWVAARETSSQTELGDGRRSSNRGKKQQKKRGKDSKKNRGSSSSSSVGDSASSSSSGSSSDSSSSSSSGDTSSGEGERRKRKEKKKQKKKKKKKEKQKEKNKKKEEEKAKEKLRGGDEKRGSRQPALGAAAENPHRRQTVPQTHVASPGEVLLLLGLMRRGRASLSHQAAASSCWNDTEVREELVKLRAVEDILPSSISRFVNHLVTDHDFEHDTSVTPEILCAAVDASRIELAEDRERAQSISFAVPEPRTRPKKVYCASSPESRGGDAPQPRMTPAPVPTPSFANSLSPLQEGVTLTAVVSKAEVTEMLGIDLTDDMVVTAIVSGGATYRSEGAHRIVGMRLTKVNDNPVSTPTEASAYASIALTVLLELREAPDGKRTSRGTPPTRRAQTKRDGGQPPAQKRPRKPRFAGLMGAHRIRWLRVPAQPDAPWIDSLRPLFGNARRAGPPPQGPRSGAPNERDPKRKPKLTESLLLKRAARRNSLQQWLSAIDPE